LLRGAVLVMTTDEIQGEERDPKRARDSKNMSRVLDAARFVDQPRWLGGWKLGEGGFRKVGLWVQQGMDGTIEDVSS